MFCLRVVVESLPFTTNAKALSRPSAPLVNPARATTSDRVPVLAHSLADGALRLRRGEPVLQRAGLAGRRHGGADCIGQSCSCRRGSRPRSTILASCTALSRSARESRSRRRGRRAVGCWRVRASFLRDARAAPRRAALEGDADLLVQGLGDLVVAVEQHPADDRRHGLARWCSRSGWRSCGVGAAVVARLGHAVGLEPVAEVARRLRARVGVVALVAHEPAHGGDRVGHVARLPAVGQASGSGRRRRRRTPARAVIACATSTDAVCLAIASSPALLRLGSPEPTSTTRSAAPPVRTSVVKRASGPKTVRALAAVTSLFVEAGIRVVVAVLAPHRGVRAGVEHGPAERRAETGGRRAARQRGGHPGVAGGSHVVRLGERPRGRAGRRRDARQRDAVGGCRRGGGDAGRRRPGRRRAGVRGSGRGRCRAHESPRGRIVVRPQRPCTALGRRVAAVGAAWEATRRTRRSPALRPDRAAAARDVLTAVARPAGFAEGGAEPMTGIEPACPAWEAGALPLSYIGVPGRRPLSGPPRRPEV